MKFRLMSLACAITLLPVAANAQLTIDMNNITCGQYLAMSPSQSRSFSAWMSGWFSYQLSKETIDLLTHEKNIANVKAWCQSNPNETVMVGLPKAITSTASAGAKLDFNKITCGDWLGYGPEDQDFVRYFMSGYYNSAANNDVLDYNRLQRNSRKVVAYCETKKSRTLPTAIQKSAS